MFSKINFTYKNSPENSKNSLILRDEIVKKNNKKSLTNCIKSYAKAHPNKIQNVEFNDISKLNNTNMIDNVFQPEIILTDEQIIDYHDANNIKNIEIKLNDAPSINIGIIDNNKNIEIKLRDSSSINSGIIDDVNKPEIPLTEEQLRQLEAIKNKYINDLSEPIEEGNFDVETAFSFVEKSADNIDSEMETMYDNTPLPFNVDRIRKRGIKIS